MARHSGNYICTFSTYDEEKIAIIREMISKSNKLNNLMNKRDKWGNSIRHRLLLRPRLGKNNPNAHLYQLGGALHRWSSQDIRREHGVRFDLYVYRR